MQRWKVTEYIYLGTVLEYHFEGVELNLSISILCLLLHCISKPNDVLFAPIHLSKSFYIFLIKKVNILNTKHMMSL